MKKTQDVLESGLKPGQHLSVFMKITASLKESEDMFEFEVFQNLEHYMCIHMLWYWGRRTGREKVLKFPKPY